MYIELICISVVLIQLLMIMAFVTNDDWGKVVLFHCIVLSCLFNILFILFNVNSIVSEFNSSSVNVIDYLAFDVIAFLIMIYFLFIIKNRNGEVDES